MIQSKRSDVTPSKQSNLAYWWAFALLTRIVASATESHWFDRNDWCQTLEPASLIARGFGIHSPETGLHIRNLSWPVLLSGGLKLSEFLAPLSVDLRIFTVNLLAGLLDLLILWGWIQMLNHPGKGVAPFSNRAKKWSLILLLFPWFTIYGAISPGMSTCPKSLLGLLLDASPVEAGSLPAFQRCYLCGEIPVRFDFRGIRVCADRGVLPQERGLAPSPIWHGVCSRTPDFWDT